MQALYTAEATVHGGREGHVRTSDGSFEANLGMPKSLGGAGGPGTNPEQLFAAGYAACFESALRLVARTQKKPLSDAQVHSTVVLGKTEEGQLQLQVTLEAKLPGFSRDDAQSLMNAAHQVCPYSRATRGNIEVALKVAD